MSGGPADLMLDQALTALQLLKTVAAFGLRSLPRGPLVPGLGTLAASGRGRSPGSWLPERTAGGTGQAWPWGSDPVRVLTGPFKQLREPGRLISSFTEKREASVRPARGTKDYVRGSDSCRSCWTWYRCCDGTERPPSWAHDHPPSRVGNVGSSVSVTWEAFLTARTVQVAAGGRPHGPPPSWFFRLVQGPDGPERR